MSQLAKYTPTATFVVVTIIILAAGCGGGKAGAVSDGGRRDGSVAVDGVATTRDGAGTLEGGLPESGGDSRDAPTNDVGGSSEGGPPDGSSDDRALHDPGSHGAPTAAVDPARYNQAIYYKILNKSSGRLLSVKGGGSDDGDTDIIYDDVAADDQLWAIEDSIQGFKKFINKKSGRALSTDHQGGSANGAVAHIWQYLANASDQDWTVGPGSTAATVKIISSARSGAVLSLVGSGTANDTIAQVSDDIDGADQDWVIVPVQTFDPTASYMLVNKNSSTALSVYQGGTSNDNPADVYPFVNQPDQYWNVIDIGGGYYHLVNAKSGRLLSLTGGNAANGTVAMIYDDVDAPDQGWAIQAQPTGFYRLANQKRPAGVLSIVNAQTSLESRAQIYDDLGARDQSWSIVPALNGVTVNALDAQGTLSAWMTGAGMEDVNHEIYGGIYSQLIFGESFQEPAGEPGISGMWSSVTTGTAAGTFTLGTVTPFQGSQYQTVTFTSGAGELGVENSGLDRWGIDFTAGQPYDGYAYLRSSAPTRVYVAAESSSGAIYDETSVMVNQTGWTRYDFSLTPGTSDLVGRVSLKLKAAGTVDIGYVFVEPGPAGRFKGLPVRADIAAALQAQGNTVLRFGGSAILAKGYRWKNMVGPRELRPVLDGWWYPQDTNGWGIFEFLSFAESAGVLGIPTLNIDESPADMADFVDYVNGAPTTTWGARRVADGHPAPFDIHRIELGNEELIDAAFATRFDDLAAAIWAKDPSMVLTVGDMSYHDVIADPNHVTGSESGLTTLAAYQTILDFAAANNGQIAIDLHTWSDGPQQVFEEVDAVASFDFWVHRYNPSVNYALNIYELNANDHDVGRALGNARAIGLFEQCSRRIKVVTSANALQPNGKNDNGWDQGLVFFDTERSWLQPPGYVTQMIAGNDAPTVVSTTVTNPNIAVTAKKNGAVMTLEVVNMAGSAQAPTISFIGYTPATATVQFTQISGNVSDQNDATNVTMIQPQRGSASYRLNGNAFTYSFPPSSFTVLRLE